MSGEIERGPIAIDEDPNERNIEDVRMFLFLSLLYHILKHSIQPFLVSM